MIDFAGADIQLENVVDLLKRELSLHTICRQLMYQKIIRAKAEEFNITVTEDEIQTDADRMRRELQLESAQKTIEWLQEKMITADDWENSIHDRLLTQKVADVMFGETSNREFNQRKLDYEKVLLYKILLPSSHLAQELAYQIEEEEISFFEAAHRYDTDTVRRRCCGYEGEVSRWALEPEVAASIFGAPSQTVVGPIELGSMYGLFFVDEFVEPTLDESVYRSICDRFFYEWLDTEILRHSP